MELTTFRHGETIAELKKKVKKARKTMYLNEISLRYEKWKAANLEITDNSEENLKKKLGFMLNIVNFYFQKNTVNLKHFSRNVNYLKLVSQNLFITY